MTIERILNEIRARTAPDRMSQEQAVEFLKAIQAGVTAIADDVQTTTRYAEHASYQAENARRVDLIKTNGKKEAARLIREEEAAAAAIALE